MSMRPFAYQSPGTIDEALSLLPGEGWRGLEDGATRPLAGGTDLITLLKGGLAAPQRLLDVKRLPDLPRGIVEGPDGLTLGALTTLAEVEQSPLLQERYPALAEAAALAATPQLRNMATLGGNLLQRPRCWYYRHPHLDCWLKGGQDCPARDGQNQLHAIFHAAPEAPRGRPEGQQGQLAGGHAEGAPCVAVHPSDPATALHALGASVRLQGKGRPAHPPPRAVLRPSHGRAAHRDGGRRGRAAAGRAPPGPPPGDAQHLPQGHGPQGVGLRPGGGRRRGAPGGAPDRRGPDHPRRGRQRPLAGDRRRAPPAGRRGGRRPHRPRGDGALEGAQPLEHNAYKVPLTTALVRRALSALTATAS